MDELTWEKSWGSGSGYGVCRMSVPWLVILILGGLGYEELVSARHIWRYQEPRSGVDSIVTLGTEIAIDGPSMEELTLPSLYLSRCFNRATFEIVT